MNQRTGHRAGGRRGGKILAILAVAALTAVACGDSDAGNADGSAQPTSRRPGVTDAADASTADDGSVTSTPAVSSTTAAPDSRRATGSGSSGGGPGACPATSDATESGPSVAASRHEVDGVGVELMVYPRDDYEGNPWSHWGQGIVLADGRFVSGIGDHLGRDGNSFVYVYDPTTAQLTQIGDIQSSVGHQPGSWGYGKIHAQMVQTTCDSVILATYWGNRRDIEFGGSYDGDHILRLDLASYEMTSLGVPVPRHGIPSMAAHGGLVYGEAADPMQPLGRDRGVFFVFDPATGEVVDSIADPSHRGFRSILVTADGEALVAAEGPGAVLAYEPGAALTSQTLSASQGRLRAVTSPQPDGAVYGVTRDPDVFFTRAPDGGSTSFGEALGYTTSIAVHPDGGVLYVPEAHGRAWKHDAGLFRVDPATGATTMVVPLLELAERELGLTLGGTYSVAVDHVASRAYVMFNAGASEDTPWGEVVLAVVDL